MAQFSASFTTQCHLLSVKPQKSLSNFEEFFLMGTPNIFGFRVPNLHKIAHLDPFP